MHPVESDRQETEPRKPLFEVRFAFGPHSVDKSEWYLTLPPDIGDFFGRSPGVSRNMVFVEKTLGTRQFFRVVRDAYLVYGNYELVYVFAQRPSKRYPPAEEILDTYTADIRRDAKKINSQDMDDFLFILHLCNTLDNLNIDRGINIELVGETRRDQKEIDTMKDMRSRALRIEDLTSIENFKKEAETLAASCKIRDGKIAEDLQSLYENAIARGKSTRIYVVLGTSHSPIEDLLRQRLEGRNSWDITSTQGSLNPNLEPTSVLFTSIVHKLSRGEEVSDLEWQKIYSAIKDLVKS